MHNASTAQEVTIITPSASNFEFRRWGDPSPMPPSPIQGCDSPASPSETDEDSASESSGGGSRTGSDGVITFDPLPRQSIRTALILDRFSTACPIHYCSNDSFLSTTKIMGRPFFDFVAQRDEALVRSWIDAVKGWGVNERGQPSDGGFGFGKFHLYPRGRDSVERMEPEPPQPQPRHGRSGRSGAGGPQPHSSRAVAHTAAPAPVRPRQPRPRPTASVAEEEVAVDAIFSAHSDGLMVILRHGSTPAGSAPSARPAPIVAAGPSNSRQLTSSSSRPTST